MNEWHNFDTNPPRGVSGEKIEFATMWRIKPEPPKPRKFRLRFEPRPNLPHRVVGWEIVEDDTPKYYEGYIIAGEILPES